MVNPEAESTNNHPEEELAKEINESQKTIKEVRDTMNQISSEITIIERLSDVTFGLVNEIPEAVNYEQQIPYLQEMNRNLRHGLAGIKASYIPFSSASGTALMASTDGSASVNTVRFFLEENHYAIPKAIKDYESFVSSPELRNEVRNQLIAWGFNISSPPSQTPLQLFDNAHKVFDTGSSRELSLIAIRGCLNEVIRLLLQKRTRQEPASSNRQKIVSICNNLGINGLGNNKINILADHYDDLVKILSGGKTGNYSSKVIEGYINQAITFLGALLKALDIAKA